MAIPYPELYPTSRVQITIDPWSDRMCLRSEVPDDDGSNIRVLGISSTCLCTAAVPFASRLRTPHIQYQAWQAGSRK